MQERSELQTPGMNSEKIKIQNVDRFKYSWIENELFITHTKKEQKNCLHDKASILISWLLH